MESESNRNNPIQVNAVKYLRALLEGDNRRIFETYRKEYATAPQDLFKNTAMMLIATNFVREPELAIQIYGEVNNEIFDYHNCDYCVVRLEVMAAALNALDQYDRTMELIEPHVSNTGKRGIYFQLVMAYLRSNNLSKLDDLLEQSSERLEVRDLNYLYFFSAYHAQLLNLAASKDKYARMAIDGYNALAKENTIMLGRCHYILEDYESAQGYFQKLLDQRPGHIFSLSKLAAIAFRSNKPEIAQIYLDEMIGSKRDYDFGYTSYFIAQAYAQGGYIKEAFRYLKDAIMQGDLASNIDYENDPLLVALHDQPEWKEIMQYWEVNTSMD